jgi:flagellar assembly protein FliH
LYKVIQSDPPEGISVSDYHFPDLADDEPPVRDAPKYEFQRFDQEKDPGPELTVAEAEAKAAAIIEQAQAEAERIKKEAKELNSEARQLKDQARQEGLQEGRAEGEPQGLAQARKNFDNQVAPLIESLSKVSELYDDLWSVNEPLMVGLAQLIAERVLIKELTTEPEAITAAFKAALEHLGEQHRAVFRMHPDDIALVDEIKGEARDRLSGLVKLEFKADDSLSRGDLVMETEAGLLDATVKRRLQAVTNAVDEALNYNFDLDW